MKKKNPDPIKGATLKNSQRRKNAEIAYDRETVMRPKGVSLPKKKDVLPKSKSQMADEEIQKGRDKFDQRIENSKSYMNRYGGSDAHIKELKLWKDQEYPDKNKADYVSRKKALGYPVMSKKEAKSRVQQRKAINSSNAKKKGK